MRRNLYEASEPLPPEIAEWMGAPDFPRQDRSDDLAAIVEEQHSVGDRLLSKLKGRLAS
ncbi:hypothetical protein [Nocardioides gilvus]|uniref:hypothetical protein n=1 Tax=Nocardioides gilvus TaxID=1735589 RepID=UPI0013A5B2A4|nr:hypothetical protein [Nocardioides gilvus]